LAGIFNTACTSQCTTNWSPKVGVARVTWHKFKIWDPFITFGRYRYTLQMW